MQREVFFARPSDSARDAALVMRKENIGFLPVCDEGGCVIGTLTDRDLAMRVCADGGDASQISVAEVMTRDLVACRPEDELQKAEQLMAKYQKSRVLVTDGMTRLLGLISIADVVERDSNKHAAHTLRKIIEREYRF